MKTCTIMSRVAVPGKNRPAKRFSNPYLGSHSVIITTVINRMSLPESPIVYKKASDFKFMYDSFYRVILHYTNWTDDSTKIISTRVKIAVPVLTLKECESIVKQASKYGMCIVCTVQQDKAILYKDAIVQLGLNATIEEA